MCNISGLVPIFGQFSGMEVSTTGEGFSTKANPDDPVYTKMCATAEDNGYTLRLIWGTSGGVTTDYKTNRANISMERAFDQKWRVGTSFYVG